MTAIVSKDQKCNDNDKELTKKMQLYTDIRNICWYFNKVQRVLVSI